MLHKLNVSVTLDRCLLSTANVSRDSQRIVNACRHIELNLIISYSDFTQAFPGVMPRLMPPSGVTPAVVEDVIYCSYQGAVQLESDCRFVRSWLQSSLHAEDVRQSVLALDVFVYLCGITHLLKQQPHGDNTDRQTGQKQRHPCK